ncbi:MAG: DUF4837 family protein [Cyclobacteriaceae bacterium]|nr:DUF4837 family protein [Cyclobacteriaceae bacterium]
MKQLSLGLFAFLALIGMFSCNIDSVNERLLVNASGRPGELFVVMDSVQWKGELGQVIRNELISHIPGLSTDEPYFTVRYIEPTKFNSVLNKAKNIVFVATLDSKTKGGETVRGYITSKYIKEHPDKFIISQSDLYAKGQSVLYLFGATEDELTNRIAENEGIVRNFFEKVEMDRLTNSLYASKELTGINNMLLKKHGFYMRIPNGFRIEEDKPSFVWLRSPGITDGSVDKSIFVSYKPYTNESEFGKKEILAWRDEITKEYIFEDPENLATYMETDTVHVPVIYRAVKVNGNFAREVRGIWRTHEIGGVGGPYISYVVLDADSETLFYLDGFVVAPGKPKRDALRELETILNTFKTKEQALSEKKPKQENN